MTTTETREMKDLFAHREGRTESKVMKTWSQYKKSIFFDSIVLCDRHNGDHVPQELLEKVRAEWQGAEIAVDTIIGWLNSPVGRSFLSEAFGVDIPRQAEDGTE